MPQRFRQDDSLAEKLCTDILRQNKPLRASFADTWTFLQWLRRETNNLTDYFLLSFAAHFGRLDLVEEFLPTVSSRGTLPCAAAASSGQVETLKFLKKNGFTWEKTEVTLALLSGSMDAVQILHRPEWKYDIVTLSEIILCTDKKEALEFVFSNLYQSQITSLASSPLADEMWNRVVRNGNVSAVEWLAEKKNFFSPKPRHMTIAATNLHGNIIDILMSAFSLRWNEDAMNMAAVTARLDVIRLAHEKGWR
jgi:hypothetical protein